MIEGDQIGTNAAGTASLGNKYGVTIDYAPDNTIGGTAVGAGNLISGNDFLGISIFGDTATGNLIAGNQIGVNAASTGPLSNDVGVDINAPNNTVGGTIAAAANLISGNSDYGVLLQNAGEDPQGQGNFVEGNLIGTNADGTSAIGNGFGVYVLSGGHNMVGGTSPSAGNVISGNMYRGIYIVGPDATGNMVEGNRIGTNAAGTAALGSNSGVFIEGGASGNTIGGTAPGAGNLISGNTVARGSYPNPAGVEIIGDTTSGNLVEGNLIGTNFDGTAALPNGESSSGGVVISGGATNNTIGGTATGARNVISGNTGAGVSIDIDQGDGTADNVVEGNVIGTNAAGTAPLPNSIGVELESPGNLVGGTTAGASNLLSGNTSYGVFISGVNATGNLIEGNLIGTDVAGTSRLSNGVGVGVVEAPGNAIGGTAPEAGNVISGNTGDGLFIYGVLATGKLAAGNLIGTDVTGNIGLANSIGVLIDSAPGNTVGGTIAGAANVISGNTVDGLYLINSPATDNLVEGNLIGTNAAGTAKVGNNVGVLVGSAGNTIGGSAAGAGNLISGNLFDGVEVYVAGNLFAGNRMGTDAAGVLPLGNNGAGISISSGDNTIGGTVPGAGNLISGNAVCGIYIALATAMGNLIEGNLIGIDVTGTNVLENIGHGIIVVSNASANTIGGTVAGARNLISGNAGSGIDIDGAPGNTVVGNDIGTSPNGLGDLGNLGHGVQIINATGNTIGGTTAAARNVISGNDDGGVLIYGGGAQRQSGRWQRYRPRFRRRHRGGQRRIGRERLRRWRRRRRGREQ